MMRISVMTICLLAAAGSTQAEDFQVWGDVDGVAPQEMMATYLLTQAHTALDRRDERHEQLKTGERYQ